MVKMMNAKLIGIGTNELVAAAEALDFLLILKILQTL